MRKVKIVSTAKYLPERVVGLEEISQRIGKSAEWIEKSTGVINRHYVTNETAPQMGAIVAREALKKAGLDFKKDIDALICASGTFAQPIPCTASIIQHAMGEFDSGIPSFDINSTCLSFVTAFDMISCLIDAGRFKRVLIVSTEIASVGINFNDAESCCLFGDGAAAVIVEKTDDDNSGVIAGLMETYASHYDTTEIRAGGTTLPPRSPLAKEEDFLFRMEGGKIIKKALEVIENFVERILNEANLTMNDLDLVIPHQASLLGVKLMQQSLKVPDEKFVIDLAEQGNVIAASIPMVIHNCIESGRINKRGQHIMLFGTSAGFSMGALIFKY